MNNTNIFFVFMLQKIKSFFKEAKVWFFDYYHLLFKSAADNHLRIQEILRSSDGTYQLTVKFDSYSALKKYQKKLRQLTISLSSAVAMVLVAFIAAPYIMNPSKTKASSYIWDQTLWAGSGNGTAVNASNQSGFSDFTGPLNTNLMINNGKVTMRQAEGGIAEKAKLDYTGTMSGFYSVDNGNGTGTVKAKKFLGQACGTAGDNIGNGECISGACRSNICDCSDTSVTASDGGVYNVVRVGQQCWLGRNMDIGTMITTTPSNDALIEKHCYSDTASNCTTYGALYDWAEALQLSQSCNNAFCASQIEINRKGICPTGYHIPTDAEFFALENYLKDTGQACYQSRSGAYSCSTAGTKLRVGGSSGLNVPFAGGSAFSTPFTGLDSVASIFSANEDSVYSQYFTVRQLASSQTGIYRSTTATKMYIGSVRCLKNQ